jgi:hypothetical protein
MSFLHAGTNVYSELKIKIGILCTDGALNNNTA